MKYFIAKIQTGYVLHELGLDQILHPLHPNPIKNLGAAQQLRADLEQDTCPLELPSLTDGFDPMAHAATSYDVAVQLFHIILKTMCPALTTRDGQPLTMEGDDEAAWALALHIADRRLWELPEFPHDPNQISF